MNTLIVQVRPFGDAFYRSSLFPWSHLLTGTQGQDPGYDPLKYMVKTAHENGLEIHAWVNPLRIQLNTNPSELAENHPYTQWSKDEMCIRDRASAACKETGLPAIADDSGLAVDALNLSLIHICLFWKTVCL